MDQLQQLKRMIQEAGRLVFFGGAGVSTESGIPDFRSSEGIFSGQHRIPAETIISAPFLRRDPATFFDFYRKHLVFPSALPNPAHRALAKWEGEGKLTGVVTQNIDGLHQMAGSRAVYELHGSIHRNHCTKCRKTYPLSRMLDEQEPVPTCACGGMIRPDVVLYGESLDPDTISQAVRTISASDMMIIGGTSLMVYPAAAFVQGYRGRLVIINKSPTGLDGEAELCISAPVGKVLGEAAGISE